MAQEKSDQFQKMTSTPVQKLIIGLSVPTITSMMVTNLYNMADTAFVGTLGNSASGAVGIVFGFMSIIQAIGFLFGQGSGSIISRSLGKQNLKAAGKIASTGFFLSFFLGFLAAVFGFIFIDPLVKFLGSTETISPYAKDYIRFILITAPFMTSSFTLNNILRFEGKAFLGMIGLVTGSVLNIAGDALFMFAFNMGIKGAGLSTAISQTVSFCILISAFLTGKTTCKISIKNVTLAVKNISEIILTGLPSLLRQGLGSIATILLNYQAATYGLISFGNEDAAVAAMSITGRVFFFIFSIALGVGQGYQPVCGFNYGAEKFHRVKSAFRFTVVFSEILMITLGTVIAIFAPQILRIFRDDDLVVNIAVYSLRVHCLASLFLPYGMAVDMTLQSSGKKAAAMIVSSLRSGLIFIPTLIILPYFRGIAGVQEAQPLSFAISIIPTIWFSMKYFKELNLLKNK